MCGTPVGQLGTVKGNAVDVASIFSRVGMGVLDGVGIWPDGTP